MKITMKIIGFAGLCFSLASAQDNPAFGTMPQNSIEQSQYFPASDHRFYESDNGLTQMMISNDYLGSSFSYFRRSDNKVQLGFNAGIISIAEENNEGSDYYRADEQYSLFLIPFWLSIKVRLTANQDGQLIPYATGGLGPTLGLDFGQNRGFVSSINNVIGQLGGGGYLGLGFDYLWAEEWAISTEVRYNIFVFEHPLGGDRRFDGFSFFIGFGRAFGM